MPRRLDPDKGLPGLFQPSKAPSGDMGFLVREPATPPRKTRGRAASKRPTPERLPAPASTISQISGKHARPAPAVAPPASDVTAASDANAPATSTGSASFDRPVVLAIRDLETEARERLLREAPPVCRVPLSLPVRTPLEVRDIVDFARSAFAWTAFTVRALLTERNEPRTR